MRWFVLCFLLWFTVNIHAQTIKSKTVSAHSVYVKGKKFEGVILKKQALALTYIHSTVTTRYSPTLNDVAAAEKIISDDIDLKINNRISVEFVRENISKYLRQYAGYLNKQGNYILLINLFWKKSVRDDIDNKTKDPRWKSEWRMTEDGGHYYAEIIINISTGEIISFGVNGEA